MHQSFFILLICGLIACQKSSPSENEYANLTNSANDTIDETTEMTTSGPTKKAGILTHELSLANSSLSKIKNIHFADVDGDNKSDLIKVYMDNVVVRKSDGEKFLKESTFIDLPFYGSVGTFFADVDGDGKADAIAVNDHRINNRITIRKSNGNEFLPNEDFTKEPFFGTIKTFFGDVDGGGKADAIAVNDNGVIVRKSDGTKFLEEENFITKPFYGSIKTDFADVNGDGMTDAIAVNDSTINNRITVRKSNGFFFEPNINFTDSPFFGSSATIFEDINGDLKKDLIVVNEKEIFIRYSDGEKFLGTVTTIKYDSPPELLFFADIDGDLKIDIIKVKGN